MPSQHDQQQHPDSTGAFPWAGPGGVTAAPAQYPSGTRLSGAASTRRANQTVTITWLDTAM